MKISNLVFLVKLLLLDISVFAGSPFLIKIDSAQKDFIINEPAIVQVTWKNISKEPINIGYGLTFISNPALKLQIKGPVRKECKTIPEVSVDRNPNPGRNIAAHETISNQLDVSIYGLCEPATYEVWIEYNPGNLSSGYIEKHSILSTPVESNHVFLNIKMPSGLDLEIFEKHHNSCNHISLTPQELLQKYPTSTYAAYSIYEYIKGFSSNNPSAVMGQMEGAYPIYNVNSYPDDNPENKRGWIDLRGKTAFEWWSKWIGIILKNHPDIWFADELRLKNAVNLIAMKRYQEAETELSKLEAKDQFQYKGAAKEYLSLMRQEGWIENVKANEKIETELPKTVSTD